MNVRNNSLHYKMYKSKKNIVYAGLVTTAALAGLTLSNVNNTVSADTTSAADNTALTTSAANTSSATSDNSAANSSATSEQIASASSNVVVKSAALSDANQAVASAQTNYNSAEQLNSGVSAINSAQQVVNGYDAPISDAQVALVNAQTSATVANNAATSASNVIGVNNMIASAASNADSALSNAMNNAIAGAVSDKNEYAPYVNQFVGQVPTSANADTLPAWKQLASNAASAVANDDAKATSAQSAWNKFVADSQAVDAQLKAAQAQVNSLTGATGAQAEQALKAAQALVSSLTTTQQNIDAQVALQQTRQMNWLSIHDADLILSQKVNEVVSAIENAVKLQKEADNANVAVQNADQALKTLQAKQMVAKQTVQSLRAKYDLPDAQGLAAMQNTIDGLQGLYNTAVSKLNKDGADTVGSGSDFNYMQKLNTIKASEAVLKSDQAALANAQSAANSASAEVASASAALAKADPSDTVAYAEASAKLAAAYAKQVAAQTQLTTAQNLVNSDIDQIKTLQNILEQFVTANKLQVYVDQYNQLPAQIKAAKEALDTANANLAAAKDADAALTAATVALNNAKAAAAAAQKAYNDAVDYYNSLINGETPAQKSDAEKYGANIIVGGTTIYQIKSQKANSTKMALAAAYAGKANSVTAVVPAPTADQVMGGKADAIAAVKSVAWADPAKVNEDATKPGNHVEEIIVTFKDGSTKTASWNLTVLPAKDDDNTDTPTTPDKPGSDSTAVTPDNNVNSGATNNGVASNGTVANGSHAAAATTTNTVSFGNGQAAVLPVASTNHVANTTAAKKNDSATLPQTGNKNTSAVVALGAVSAMFGLGLAAKKREF